MEELQRLEELKKQALENPLPKKRGCRNCKKKAEDNPVEVLPEPVELVIEPTEADLKLALDLMVGKPNETDQKFITWVYKSLFNEEIPVGCGSCGTTAERKLRHKYNQLRGVKG